MGIHLVSNLISAGHDVTIATRGNAPDPFGDKVTRLAVDRYNPDSLRNALEGKFYDVTVDNLAYSSNDVRYLLDVLNTKKYVMTSTASVYAPSFHENMREAEVDTNTLPLVWCNADDFPYDEVKRQAENALFQAYLDQVSSAIRFPFIFGEDDYTKRLYFYIEHLVQRRAMNIDNMGARLSFINSREAGRLLAHIATGTGVGYINASSNGTISLEKIIGYAEKRAGMKVIIEDGGDAGTFNGIPSFSLDTSIAAETGYKFMDIGSWVYPLIDYWIDTIPR